MRKIGKPLVAVALIGSGLAVAPSDVRAAVITVTTPDDETISNGQTSLREAFAIAGSNGVDDTIVLADATNYVIDFCADGPLVHGEPQALTVQGGTNTSIQNVCDGMQTIVMDGEDADLTVDSVEMTGFYVGGGPDVSGIAISAAGGGSTTVISNSDIHGFGAGADGSAVYGGQGLSFTPDLHIVSSSIWGNEGNGVRISDGSVTVTGSDIYQNTGTGLRLTDGRPLMIANSTVTDNGGAGATTTGQGDANVTVTGTTITGNGDVGLRCTFCNSVTVSGSNISDNGGAIPPAGFGGGGVYATWQYDQPTDAPTMSITGSTIDGNTAEHDGGGVFVGIGDDSESSATPAVLTIDDTSVSANQTIGFSDVDGGGIYVETGDLIVTNGSTVSTNSAGPPAGSGWGGGIYHRDADALTTDPVTQISGSIISSNTSANRGGGISIVHAGAATITGSTVSDNTSTSSSGGGVAASGADVAVTDSIVSGNDASTGGGLALLEFSGYPEGSLTVEGSTVDQNTSSFAASGGGGIWVNVGDAGADAVVRNSTVAGNSSANFGGGIMVMQTSRLTLDHATVVDNAGSNGSNVWVAVGDLDVTASAIALPQGSGDNCGTFSSATVSGGYTFADDGSCNLGASDFVDAVDPELAPLADNGGPTPTRLPAATSPLGGLVPAGSCVVPVDQRGIARPQGTDCEAGAVEITEDSGPEPMMGTDGDDILTGTPGDDIIIAGAGNDVIFGRGGNDIIVGGPGRELIFGGPGDDDIDGGDGNDVIFGGAGDDALAGGEARDVLIGGRGTDALDGGPGRDICFPSGGTKINC